jgi:Rv0078B-related antitoxin
MDPKPRPNHRRYLEILRGMTAEQKLQIVFDLTETVDSLFREGLRRRFPDATEEELHRIYLKRLEKCYNRNY